jgi:tetratricopeptide (TPR) repeat protein
MKCRCTKDGAFEERRWKAGWLVVAVALSATTATMACQSAGSTSGCPSAEQAGPPVDAALMAFLSAARALHHEADLREGASDRGGAIASLERLVALPAPKAVEVEEVLADARARLADLRLEQGDLEGAERDVRSGLAQVTGPTYFRGHLLEVGGRIEEARSRALADAGKPDEAARAKARAVALLEDAVHVQERVIARALGDGGNDE